MSLNEPSMDFHVRLQEAPLKIPFEAMKRNLKALQKLDEKQFKKTEELVTELCNCEDKDGQRHKLKLLITSLKQYEKKVRAKVDTEQDMQLRITKRVNKLEELRTLKESSTADSTHRGTDLSENKLLKWYRDQTNLLVADYLLKNDPDIESNSGLLLLKSFHFEDLIDSDIILQSNRISSLILQKDLTALIAWINENRSHLRKIKSHLEFETRFQEYIELIKAGDLTGGIKLFNEYLIHFTKTNFHEIQMSTGLLIFAEKTQQQPNNPNFVKYTKLLSTDRYKYLSGLFIKIYYKMHGIPDDDPLLVYLSVGITSLKTRSCSSSTDDHLMNFNDILTEKLSRSERLEEGSCPVCSSEFRKLNTLLPYSHNVQSHLFETPVMLPNGNIYDKTNLIQFSKGGASSTDSVVVDPLTLETFTESDMITMFPT